MDLNKEIHNLAGDGLKRLERKINMGPRINLKGRAFCDFKGVQEFGGRVEFLRK